MNFSDLRLIVAGDVCDDEMIVGVARRISREVPGIPILDVVERTVIEGGAGAAYRQGEALGADSFLVPTGRASVKTRLIAVRDGIAHQIGRFDQPWPAEDPGAFTELIRGQQADVILYSQYRPGRPASAILREVRRAAPLRVGDIRGPSDFAGTLEIVKIGVEDAWAALAQPRPRQTPLAALDVAALLAETYGFQIVVITLGSQGYAAASMDGARIMGPALEGGRRLSGAGDVFSATLALALAGKYELRDALELANTAAGLACRKDVHLSTVSKEELEQWANLAAIP